MNLEQLNQKLLAVARRNAPSDHVPYAFEKRIIACLATVPVPDSIALWAHALWRAAVPCVAAVLLLGVCALFVPHTTQPVIATTASTELSQDFENTLLAAVDQNDSNEEVR